MTASSATIPPPARLRIQVAWLQRASLWLFVASGAVVVVEPSPYEVMFLVAAGLFAVTGLKISPRLAPLLVMLLLFNLGGAFSLIPFLHEKDSVTFIAVSVYLMFTTLFFAALMTEDADGRLATIRSALIASAWIASLPAVIGYFNVAGLGELFSLYSRASGTFKDPNVLGSYLVLPVVYIVQSVFLGRVGWLRGGLFISVPLIALFLSFSRGAWANLVASIALMLVLSFLTSRSTGERARVILIAAAGVVVAVMGVAAALSIDAVRTLFEIRASLDQSHDSGVTGRFGNQLRSISILLETPNGFGPLRFRSHFGEDPHNVFINAFASYGWLGGISYMLLIATTWLVGWRAVFMRTPVQAHAIAIWATLFVTTVQGFQIDTDHWRHFYLMLGLMWGLAMAVPRFNPIPSRRTASEAAVRT